MSGNQNNLCDCELTFFKKNTLGIFGILRGILAKKKKDEKTFLSQSSEYVRKSK